MTCNTNMNNTQSFDFAQDHRPAGFWIRFLAYLLDWAILMLPVSLLALYVTNAASLQDLFYRLLVSVIIWAIPSTFFYTFFYTSWLVSRMQATPGKYLTGLRVTDNNGHSLSYKRAFFRYTVGYAFSGILFGLGFFSIARDPEKLAWHDKATGSRVIILRPLWLIAILILLALTIVQVFFWSQAINQITSGAITKQAGSLTI